jgi:hypothetical protein
MKHIVRMTVSALVFLVLLMITIHFDAYILRQGSLHHPYIPGISDWIDRIFLVITIGGVFITAFWFYRLTEKSRTRSMDKDVRP